MHSPELAAMCRVDAESRRGAGESSVESIIIRGELLQHLQACGFGWRSTAEAVRLDGDAANGVSKLAGYITKIAGHSEKTHGELAKLSQVPLMAPKNFRRLRSGKNFLPKRRKGDMTGALLRRYPAREGDEVAEAVTRSPDPEYMAHVRACVKQEQELVFEDERRVATNRFCVRWGLALSKVPPVQAFLLPPVKIRPEGVVRRTPLGPALAGRAQSTSEQLCFLSRCASHSQPVALGLSSHPG